MLRRLFFSLGVLLGIVAPQEAPDLAARVFRSNQDVYLNAELDGAFPAGSLELAAAGSEVAFELTALVEGKNRSSRALRSLRFDRGEGMWLVGFGGDGEAKRVAGREAALLLASRVWALRIGELADFESGGTVLVQARSGIVDRDGGWHDAGILWGYSEPSRRFAFASPVEIPR